MIFFTAGTERFHFDRLAHAADLVKERLNGEPVLIQLGETGVKPEKCDWVNFLPFPEFVDRAKEARIIVTHAGVGILLLCRRLAKVPIVLPRERKRGEHVDDHQVELARKMAELGYILLADRPEEIAELIEQYDQRLKDCNGSSLSSPKLVEVLSEYFKKDGLKR